MSMLYFTKEHSYTYVHIYYIFGMNVNFFTGYLFYFSIVFPSERNKNTPKKCNKQNNRRLSSFGPRSYDNLLSLLILVKSFSFLISWL